MNIDFTKELMLSKHFRNTWLRKWDWDTNDLRIGLQQAYRIDKIGKNKYETYTRYKSGGRSRKTIFLLLDNRIYAITGAEGT